MLHLVLSVVLGIIIVSSQAAAQAPVVVMEQPSNEYTEDYYLGTAHSAEQCHEFALQYGYRASIYGPGHDYQGKYYAHLNACFARQRLIRPAPQPEPLPAPEPEVDGEFYFYIQVAQGYERQRCGGEVEKVLGIWKCQTWRRSSLECSPSKIMTQSEANTLAEKLKRLFCVESIATIDRSRNL